MTLPKTTQIIKVTFDHNVKQDRTCKNPKMLPVLMNMKETLSIRYKNANHDKTISIMPQNDHGLERTVNNLNETVDYISKQNIQVEI